MDGTTIEKSASGRTACHSALACATAAASSASVSGAGTGASAAGASDATSSSRAAVSSAGVSDGITTLRLAVNENATASWTSDRARRAVERSARPGKMVILSRFGPATARVSIGHFPTQKLGPVYSRRLPRGKRNFCMSSAIRRAIVKSSRSAYRASRPDGSAAA